jgi:predicted NAD/FAD-dependent oxidoreductase
VVLFDKSRGVGGRVASRRADPGLVFNHGLQYLRGATVEFAEQLQAWCDLGVIREWNGSLVRLPLSGHPIPVQAPFKRFVCDSAATALPKYLSNGMTIRTNITIRRVERSNDGWRLFNTEAEGPFDRLVIAVPPQQAIALLGPQHPVAQRIATVQMSPVWALMLGLAEKSQYSFDAARLEGSPFAWMMRTQGIAAPHECWSFHVDGQWSRQHIELEPDAVADLLRPEIKRLFGTEQPLYLAAHRWRYALAAAPMGEACVEVEPENLTLVGDWCLGDRAEHAWLSGRAVRA